MRGTPSAGLSINANWRYERGVHRKLGSPKQEKSINLHLKATVHPGHWQIEVADEDIHGHANKPERQQTPKTNPDWTRLLLSSKVRGGGQGRRVDGHTGNCERQGGKGSQRRRRRMTRNTSGVKTKKLDDGMHENGKPAIGPDCERINACSVRERRGHTTTSLKRTSID